MYKTSLLPIKLIAPIGLLLLSASFVIRHFAAIPDFADGFLKGLSIGMILLALIYKWYVKRNEN